MLICILLPLFTSWLFQKLKFKWIYFTYLFSGGIVLVLPLLIFIIKVLSVRVPDTTEMPFDKGAIMSLISNTGLTLFLTVFFQYIFNKTMGLTKKVEN
jgi:hypothetical protein